MITNLTLVAVLMQIASIDGQVRDVLTRKPLASVKVELSHQGIPTTSDYTDEAGRFRFTNVPPGRYTVSAGILGYDSRTVEFDPTMSNFVEIELAQTINRRQAVTPIVSLRDLTKDSHKPDCAKAIKHSDNAASTLNDLGNCYRKLGEFESAESSFKQAMKLSDSAYIALNLAELYTAQKRFNDADKVLNLAILRTPDNGDAYYGLSLAYFQEGRFDEAEAAALQADARTHRVADLHLLLAKLYVRRNADKAKVVEQLELYVKEAPNSPEAERVRQALKGGTK